MLGCIGIMAASTGSVRLRHRSPATVLLVLRDAKRVFTSAAGFTEDEGFSWNSSWAYFMEPFPPNTMTFRLTHRLWRHGANTETSDVHLAHSLSQQSPSHSQLVLR